MRSGPLKQTSSGTNQVGWHLLCWSWAMLELGYAGGVLCWGCAMLELGYAGAGPGMAAGLT